VNSFNNYLDRLGSNFLVAAMTPSLGLVVACLFVFDPILHTSVAFQNDRGLYSLVGITLILTIPTVIVGFTLTALNTFLLKLFEGYIFFHHFHFMRSAQSRRATRLLKQRDSVREQIIRLQKKRSKSIDDRSMLDYLKNEYYNLATDYDQNYPPPGTGYMPTKFGNILKASEAYSGNRYGIDSVQFWPRLLFVIPPNYRQTIEEARNELSFLVNISTLSVVFYLLCILAKPLWL
jgi:hypothetical protein